MPQQFRPARTILALAMLGLCLGCGARKPGSLETSFMGHVKRSVTIRGKSDTNPLPASAENVAAGRTYFSAYCMVCHGLDGQNTGVPFATRMSPPVPELNSPPVQAYSDGQLKWIIENGIFPSGMPASRGMLRDEEMWAIVDYIRHLPRKGSLGEPAVYGGSTAQ